MSEFDYLALDTAGRERRGSVRAASAEDARATLGARKLYVVRMEAATGASAAPLLSRRALLRKKLSGKQLTLFTRQLATLLKSGVTLVESMNALIDQLESVELKAALTAGKRPKYKGQAAAKRSGGQAIRTVRFTVKIVD